MNESREWEEPESCSWMELMNLTNKKIKRRKGKYEVIYGHGLSLSFMP